MPNNTLRKDDWRRLLRAATSHWCLLTLDGQLQQMSPLLASELGYTDNHAINGKDFIDPKDQIVCRTVYQSICEGQPQLLTIHLRHNNGTYKAIPLQVTATRKEPLLYCVGDIVAEQRQRDQKQLRTVQYEFAVLASHQLRTPLSAIRWILDMFLHNKAGPINEFQRELLDDAKRCSIQMAHTIRHLFLITQLESKRLDILTTQTNVRQVVDNVLQSLTDLSSTKHLRVSVSCSRSLQTETDPKLLSEVFDTILHNAMKYTPEKGKIKVRIDQKDNQVHIKVQDSGWGIPDNEKNKVFSKFYRGSNIVKKDTEGDGLGLYLAHGLVNLLGGSIQFQSQLNKGTTFELTMPSKTK